MQSRMPAVRMFSVEFNASTEAIEETINSFKATMLLSPLGCKFGRVFVVGTLLEVSEAKQEPKILRARISDPHGAFTLYASTYQPQPLAALSELEPPCFVAVVAKPKLLGSRPFLRPEFVTAVEESTFDRWIEETTAATRKRIEAFERQESEEAKLAREKYNTNVEEFKALVEAKTEEIELDVDDFDDF